MNIAVFFTVRKINGGAYQYAMTFLEVLKQNPEHHYIIFNSSPDLPEEFLSLANFEVVDLQKTSLRGSAQAETKQSQSQEIAALPSVARNDKKTNYRTKIKIHLYNLLLRLHLFPVLRLLTKISQKKLIYLINSKKIDLAIFTMTNKLAMLLPIPVIVPIHDVEHRMRPEFPEVSSGKIWLQREYLCSQIAQHASKILVDSEIGRQDVINCYHPDPKKIVILPFLPPNYLQINSTQAEINNFLSKNHLPDKFLFYPAQFWPHKNHTNLVKAIGLLKQQGLIIPLVLTGAKKDRWGTWKQIQSLIKEFNVTAQVHYLGYVDNAEITILYKQAVAMVIPTFLGPTNIPVYEAWQMGTPVLYSNIRGPREQAGNAALLFDPSRPENIAEKIKLIWTDENLRKDLIEKGHKRLSLWTEKDFANKVNELIKEISFPSLRVHLADLTKTNITT